MEDEAHVRLVYPRIGRVDRVHAELLRAVELASAGHELVRQARAVAAILPAGEDRLHRRRQAAVAIELGHRAVGLIENPAGTA